MTTALTSGNLKISLNLGMTKNVAVNNATLSFPISFSKSKSLADGSAANQAQVCVELEQTYSTGGTTLNLAALTHAFGSANFTAVKLLVLVNESTTTGENITIGAAGTTPFLFGMGGTTPTITLLPGEVFVITNYSDVGWATTGATNLKIVSAAGTPAARVLIAGEGSVA